MSTAGVEGRSVPERLWTPDDLSEFLTIPEKTLRQWRSKGYGPPWRKVGKHVRYEPAAVLAWFESLTYGADDDAIPRQRRR
jgi:hypothetical protein